MPHRIVIGDKGKSWKVEIADEALVGKSVGDKISGKDVKSELEGYEFEITGGSDESGFPLSKDAEGLGLKRVLLTKGWGMHDSREGVRLRKTVRGKVIGEKTSQINLKLLKHGHKKLEEIFPEQSKKAEAKAEGSSEVKAEVATSAQD